MPGNSQNQPRALINMHRLQVMGACRLLEVIQNTEREGKEEKRKIAF